MPHVDEHGRTHPPAEAGEVETLRAFLDYQRATLAWKTRGLDADALRQTTAASTMTLGGLLNHLAYVEDYWFSQWLHGNEQAPHFDTQAWLDDPDWDWHSAALESPDVLRGRWEEAVERSNSLIDEALARGGLDQLAASRTEEGETCNLRWILVHMIEEYARHNGHADLLREAIDGETGE